MAARLVCAHQSGGESRFKDMVQVKKAKIGEPILDAARRLFEARDYVGTSVNEIGQATGVAPVRRAADSVAQAPAHAARRRYRGFIT